MLHIALVVLTVGLWLLAIPSVIAWRRGERGWALGLGAAALVALVAVGNLLPSQDDVALTASGGEPGSNSASPTAGSAQEVEAHSTPPGSPSPTIAAFADGAAKSSARATTAAKATPLARATSTRTTSKAAKITTKPAAPTTKPAVSTQKTTTTGVATRFANCTEMRKVYPHGVGKPGAVDHTTGTPPVTNYFASASLYAANSGSDRDKDGIACEKL